MANVRKRTTKDGSAVYEIRVTLKPTDGSSRKKQLQMSWKAPDGWSQKSIDRELEKIKADFERDCRAGLVLTKEERIAKEQAEREEEERRKQEEERQLTFSRYAETFLNSRKSIASDNTIVNYRVALNAAAVYLGKLKMVDIRPVDVKNYVNDHLINGTKANGELLAHGTALKHYIVLHAMFEAACKDDIISVSPMMKMKRPKPRKDELVRTKVQAYSEEQVQIIRNALTDEPLKWKTLVSFMIDSGCRRGETVGLKWECINFETGMVNIIYNAQYTEGRGTYITTPKSGKGRSFRVNAPVIALLKEWKREQALLLFKQGIPQSEFVFTHEDGKLMNPQAPTSYLRRFGKKCGIDDLHPHALRHTMITLSIANGADIVSISQKAGHSEVATTVNIYAQENEAAKERAAQALADVLYKENLKAKA